MGVGRKIIRGFFALSTAEVISKLIFFVSTIYLARLLGPDQFGALSFALALLTYFSLGAGIGLDTLGIKLISRDKNQVRLYVQQILPLMLFIGLVSFLLFNCLLFSMSIPLPEKHLIFLFSFSIFPTVLLIEWVFQGLERFDLVGASKIFFSLSYSIAILMFVGRTGSIYLVPIFWFLSLLISVVFLFLNYGRYYGWPKFTVDIAAWKLLIMRSWPMGIQVVFGIILANLGVIVLGFMRSNQEVGYYNAVYKFLGVWCVLMSVYAKILFPVMAHFHNCFPNELGRVVGRSLKLALAFAAPITSGGVLLAHKIIMVVYGETYIEGATALQILCCVIFFITINSVISWALIAVNREKQVLMILTFQVLLNILLNLLLIPKYGIVGAASATALAEFLGVFLNSFAIHRLLGIDFYAYLPKQIIAAVLMIVFLCLTAGFKIFLVVPAGILIYFFCLVILGGVTRKEAQMVFGYFFNKPNEAGG